MSSSDVPSRPKSEISISICSTLTGRRKPPLANTGQAKAIDTVGPMLLRLSSAIPISLRQKHFLNCYPEVKGRKQVCYFAVFEKSSKK
jgi:hypothetical protein